MSVSFPQSPDLTLGKVVNAFHFGKLMGKWHLIASLFSQLRVEFSFPGNEAKNGYFRNMFFEEGDSAIIKDKYRQRISTLSIKLANCGP